MAIWKGEQPYLGDLPQLLTAYKSWDDPPRIRPNFAKVKLFVAGNAELSGIFPCKIHGTCINTMGVQGNAINSRES